MLRILWRPGDPVYDSGLDPNATFEPGQIEELTVLGNQVVLKTKEEKEKDVTSSSGRK